ncbi:MAG: glycerophosphodiester phosphodiesterase [Candidatus Thorarchaeota archaeon]|jgi:glycerophosphoryl diester phosphodiesterase
MKIIGNTRPLIMAHRGDSAAAPENTLLSLRRAVEIGVDFLETDVRLTEDDELVLFHDDDLTRTTGESGSIRDKTLDELKQIDFGNSFTTDEGASYPYRGKGHTILTLAEAFHAFPEMMINLDIKDKDLHAPELLAATIREHGREDSVMVGSFHDAQAYRFRILMPEVRTSACPSEVSRFVFALKMRVLRLFARGSPYEAFQVPMKYDRAKMEWLIDLGVDGIFTDEPALLRDVLVERGLL